MPGAAAKSRYHSKAGVDKGLRTVANVSASLWDATFLGNTTGELAKG